MSRGLSKQVLEYLIWACVCMESSIPLLTVKYLNWRVQLYTVVAECYYDLKCPAEAEEFSRRALNKVIKIICRVRISTSQFAICEPN